MIRKFALTLVAAVAAGSAVAGTAYVGDIAVETDAFTSSRSRAEVQAELAQYKQAGVNPWSNSYNPLKSFVSTKTRDQVTAEFLGARDQVAAFTREDSGSAYLARNGAAAVDVERVASQSR